MSSPNKPLAYEAYQQLADAYADKVPTKPHNAYYDRPAVLSLLPDIAGKKVLDAGCGPGVYAAELVSRGAQVVAGDVSERMLEHARRRLADTALVLRVDLEQPLTMFQAEEFEVVLAPLCLDYLQDWPSVLSEFHRVLRPGGKLIASTGHPMFDAEYFQTDRYFEVEQVECDWTGFGKKIRVPSFRRSLQLHLMAFIQAGFVFEQILEPLPTQEFQQSDPVRYDRLLHRPAFLCVRVGKP